MILAFTKWTDKIGENTNAKNWPGFVLMTRRLPYSAAIWAQEAYEATLKLNPIVFLRMLFDSKNMRQYMEIRGHEIEVQAAIKFYGASEYSYRNSEVQALKRYYPEFKDRSLDWIENEMYAVSDWAKDWVENHSKQIEKYVN